MFIANTIKIAGCTLMLFEVNPLAAYALVGLGAGRADPAVGREVGEQAAGRGGRGAAASAGRAG